MNLEKAIRESMENHGESEEDVEQVKLFKTSGYRDVESSSDVDSLEDLDIDFDSSYGSESGPRFYLWTENRVYFKQIYDGSESVTSVPRKPTDEVPPYVGGG